MSHLSAHFSLEAGTKSQTAERMGIDNAPSPDVLERMKATAENILEPVWAHYGLPVIINSFYRCPELNRAIGSKDTSQHVTGEAVDFEVPGIPNHEVAQWVRDNLTFDQCILEFYTPGKPASGWVHVSFVAGACRAECLTINNAGTLRGLIA